MSFTTTTGNPPLTTTTTGSTAPGVAPTTMPSINFRQLEEFVKKATIDLGDTEKEFIDMATKINYWDKILMSNSEKILKMNDGMDRVKTEHDRMDNLIDYVKNYQKDFESLLETVEANCLEPATTTPERAAYYGTIERLNTELQQMSEDLKEIIRVTNVSNKLSDRTDPVSQIVRILNEHTDALQWIDDTTIGLRDALDDVSKMHQVFRRDQERSLRLMFKPN